MRRIRPIETILIASGMVLSVDCSGHSGSSSVTSSGEAGAGTTNSDHTLAVSSWWASPGETDALQSLMDSYAKTYADANVANLAIAGGGNARSWLAQEIHAGSPPDVFQQNGYRMAPFLTALPNSVQPVDDIFNDPSLRDSVIETAVQSVTINGHIVGVPIAIHRENSVFYNYAILTSYNVTAPTSLSQLLDACTKLKKVGIKTPLAMGGQNWIINEVFVDVLQATMGATAFRDFMTGTTPITDSGLQGNLSSAIDTFQQVMACADQSVIANTKVTWTDAANQLMNGSAAILMHGDWVKGYLQQMGWTPNVDFTMSAAPGTSDIFWYDVDVLALASQAAHPQSGHDFLVMAVSLPAQVAFSALKGSIPIRKDARPLVDTLTQSAIDDISSAAVTMAVVADGWGTAAQTFATDGNKASFLAAINAAPPNPDAPVDPEDN
jgi:glucose/mannose transport system substrate-binding protein